MNQNDDRGYIEQCLDNHFRAMASRLPAASVPAAMAVDQPDEDGFVAWKMLPSTVTEQDVTRLERQASSSFPPIFRTYLTTRHTLGMDWFDLPNLPADNALAGLKAVLDSWAWLIPAGYLPFLDDAAGGIGPLCFDTRRWQADGDNPVILFDREELLQMPEDERDRAHLEALATAASTSFRSMLGQLADGLAQPDEPSEDVDESNDEPDEPLE